jgi:AsmA protein
VIRKLLLALVILIIVLVLGVFAAVVLIDPDDYRDQIAQRASETLGREVRLDGPMSLTFFPWLALEIQDVHVGNPLPLVDAPPLAQIGTATASVRVMPMLRGELETGALTLRDAQLTLVTGPGGQSNLDGLLAGADPAPDAPPLDLTGVNLGSVTLEQVDLIQLDLVSGARTVLAIERMVLDAFAPERPVGFSLEAGLSDASGELLVIDALSGTMTLSRDAAELQVTDLSSDYRLPGSDVRGRASGRIQVQRAAETRVVVDAFETAIVAAGQSMGLRLGEPLTLTLGQAIDLGLTDAQVSLNDQRLQASGRVRFADQLSADLRVSGEELDLRPFMAAGGAEDPSNAESAAGDFTALRSINLAFRLDLEDLIVSNQLRLSEVVAEARLREGRLVLTPMQAQLFGGAFNGRVDIDFNQTPPTVALQPALSDVAIDQLAELSGRASPLSGLVNAQLSLDFSGLNLAGILASMNGSGRFEIAEGALEGIDLRRLIDEELTVNNLSNVSRAFGGRTEFQSLVTGVEIVDGVLELPDLNLTAADYGVQGQGRIDFAADRIDYRLQLDLGPELTQRLPGTLRDATRGRIPLAIGGPVAQPVVTLDMESLLESAVRQQIVDRLLRPRDEDEAAGPDAEASGEPSADSETETDAPGEPEQEPERERTSQVLLRGLLERALEDAEEEAPAEADTEGRESDPPP